MSTDADHNKENKPPIQESGDNPLDLPNQLLSGNVIEKDISLDKLVNHATNIQKQNMALAEKNKELDSLLKMFLDSQNGKIKDNIDTQVLPWVEALDISDDDKKMFLEAIQRALLGGHEKGVANFESNPVWSVACAASSRHARLTRDNEELLAKVNALEQKSSQNILEQTSAMLNNTIMYNTDSNQNKSLGKRSIDDISAQSNDITTKCWTDVFDGMSRKL